jgi:RNA polymerase sigma factor (sigma-70 family)
MATPSGRVAESARIVACIPRLRRYARALLGTAVDADDLVQDTLERAFSRLHQWRSGGDPRVWLFSIMHNRFIDLVRSGRSLSSERPGGRPPQVPVAEASVDGLVLRDLAAALEKLPLTQREVLLLVSLEQMTYADVAASLGLPLGTVMSRLSRGREALRAIMEGRPPPASLRVVE